VTSDARCCEDAFLCGLKCPKSRAQGILKNSPEIGLGQRESLLDEAQLAGHGALKYAGVVGVDAEGDACGECLADWQLLDRRDDAEAKVAGWTEFEMNPLFCKALDQSRIFECAHAVADAVWLTKVERVSHPLRTSELADVDFDPDALLADSAQVLLEIANRPGKLVTRDGNARD